ncbi:MAG: cobalamin biosynthesis protein CobD [Nitrospirae bacterium]|nr:MAG: cobalamin biosynthesis protein CobD [Nitrospirota bacterium]
MTSGEILLACLLDAVLGDPRWLPHPVRLMGWAIAWCDERIRPVLRSPAGERVAGIVLAVGLPVLAYAVGWLAIEMAGRVHWVFGRGVEVVLACTTLAARDLADHALSVVRALEAGRLQGAREAVSRIVGRDTAELSESDVARATVETVAESTSDGVIAPLFYMVIGGAPLALAYKAVNTLDSMVGHRDRKHRYFGWASAKCDDGANWIPARVTAVLLVLAGGLIFRNADTIRRAWRIFVRDGKKHPSPNSGRPEAAMAGVLGVQLGGTNVYAGVPSARPPLGDPGAPLDAHHIRSALWLMTLSVLLAAGLAAVLRLL